MGDLLQELSHALIEAERSHDLQAGAPGQLVVKFSLSLKAREPGVPKPEGRRSPSSSMGR